MFIVPGQDLAAYRAFFQQIDGSEHFSQSIGAGCGKETPASNLGEVLKKRQIRAR